MLDLFGQPALSGLQMADGIVSPDRCHALEVRCAELEMEPYRHQGYEAKRLVRRFGWGPEGAGEPIPEWLIEPRNAAARAFGRDAGTFDQALVIRYDPGAGIGWHRDRPPYREVIGLSLGTSAEMDFRCRREDGRFDRAKLPLVPGSAYLLSGSARFDWQHGIASHAARRFSLTFRSR